MKACWLGITGVKSQGTYNYLSMYPPLNGLYDLLVAPWPSDLTSKLPSALAENDDHGGVVVMQEEHMDNSGSILSCWTYQYLFYDTLNFCCVVILYKINLMHKRYSLFYSLFQDNVSSFQATVTF